MAFSPRTRRRLVRALAALGIAATLGGCIFVPVGEPGYYHRPRYYHYY